MNIANIRFQSRLERQAMLNKLRNIDIFVAVIMIIAIVFRERKEIVTYFSLFDMC